MLLLFDRELVQVKLPYIEILWMETFKNTI